MKEIVKAANATQEEFAVAFELHTRIMVSGKTAAMAMVEFARNLKQMRDEKLYLALGLETFDAYADEVVGIGQRQAYTYIRALEQLGPKMMEEHATLGITKLEILSQVWAVDRQEFMQEHDLESMSAREMRELVAKLKDSGEQLSLLQEENEDLARRLAEAVAPVVQMDGAAEAERLQQQVDSLSALLEEAEGKISAARIEGEEAARKEAEKERKAAVSEAKKEAEQKAADKIKKAEEAKAAAEKAAAEEKKKAEERVKAVTAAAEEEKAASLARAAELEKRLKLAASPDVTAVAVYVDEVAGLLNKALAKVRAVKTSDPDAGTKLARAMTGVLDNARPHFEEEGKE